MPAVTLTNNLNLTAFGNITQTGAINASAGTTTLDVTKAGSDILLGGSNTDTTTPSGFANNFGSNAIAFAGTLSNIRDLSIRNTNGSAQTPTAANFTSMTNLRNLTLEFDNAPIVLPTLSSSGVLTAIGGAISQSGALTVTGASDFSAGANAIDLTDNGSSNSFTGAVSLYNSGGSSVQLTNNSLLTVGTVNVGSGTLALNGIGITEAGTGVITQAGSAGNASITGNAGVINLNNNSNAFTGTVLLSNSGSNAVTLNNSNTTLNLGLSTLGSGVVNITNTSDPLNINDAISASGSNLNITTLPTNTLEVLTVSNTGSVTNTNGSVALTSSNNAAGKGIGLVINGLVSSGSGSGGTLIVGGGLALNVAPTVGSTGHNVTLQGNGMNLDLGNSDFHLKNYSVNFSVPGYIAVLGALISAPGQNLILTADNGGTSLTGNGGVYIGSMGSITSTGNISLSGSNLGASGNPVLDPSNNPIVGVDTSAGIQIVSGATITASGSITLSEGSGNNNIDVYSPLQANFNPNTSLPSGSNLPITITPNGTGSINLSANLSSYTGNISLSAPVNLSSSVMINAQSGAINFSSSLNGAGQTLTLDDNTAASTGSANFTGNVSLATLTTFAEPYSISMHGGATITNATGMTFNNTGSVTLNNNGIYNFTNGLDTTAPSILNLGGTVNTTDAAINLGAVGLLANSALSSTGAAITLNSAVNDSSVTPTHNLTLTAGAGTINVKGPVGGTNVLNALTASGGTVQESGSGTIASTTLTTNSTNGTTLTNVNNVSNFNATNGTAGNISFTNGSPLTITGLNQSSGNATFTNTGALNFNGATQTVSGNLIVNDSGLIAQTNALTVGGTSNFNAGANGISLTNTGNQFTGAVTLTNSGTNDVSLDNSIALVLGSGSSIGRNLTVTQDGTGKISQAGAITVNGTTTIQAHANAIDLSTNGSGNDFVGAVSLNNTGANNVTLTNGSALVIGASPVGSGTLSLTSGGTGITETGAITQSGAGAISLAVTAASSNIILDQANNLPGTISFAGTLSNIQDFTLHNINAGATVPSFSGVGLALRNLQLTFDAAAINMPAVTLTGSLNLSAFGNITESGVINDSSGTTTLAVTKALSDILLGSQANDLGSNAIVLGGTLGDIRDLSLRNINTNAQTPSAANFAGMTTTLRNLTLEFDAAPIALPALTTSTISLVPGALTVIAGGAITQQTGTLKVAGTSSFAAGANLITLINASNDFIGAVSLSNSESITMLLFSIMLPLF